MNILLAFFLILVWLLSVGSVVTAPYTGWVWAKGGLGAPAGSMLFGFKAYRDDHPFTYWLTYISYVSLIFLIPLVCLGA